MGKMLLQNVARWQSAPRPLLLLLRIDCRSQPRARIPTQRDVGRVRHAGRRGLGPLRFAMTRANIERTLDRAFAWREAGIGRHHVQPVTLGDVHRLVRNVVHDDEGDLAACPLARHTADRLECLARLVVRAEELRPIETVMRQYIHRHRPVCVRM